MMVNQLIQQAQPYWKQYVEHEFVQQFAKGTLPKACFQHYLKQDLWGSNNICIKEKKKFGGKNFA